jgi:hypothetical protein
MLDLALFMTISTVPMTDPAAFKDLDIAGIDVVNQTVDVISDSPLQGFSVLKTREVDTRLAPDSQYQTPDKVAARLADLHARFPNLTHVQSIGKSLQGRDIWAMKIATTPEAHDPAKPAVLFNGMHHAREVMTPEVVIDTAEQLLEGYGKDAKLTAYVDADEIWVMPMLNVDGNDKVWHGNNMWRKNAASPMGTDINRNYPYKWGSCNGSSPLFFMDDYRGTAAGSEPETQAMMGFVKAIQPVLDISYHSYSELVIYPYGCDNTHAEAREVVEGLGKEMAAKLPRDDGKGTYEPGASWEILYTTDGTDIDWMYHDQGVLAYTIEVNNSAAGFQPDYKLRQPTVEKLRAAWTYALDRVAGSGVRGMAPKGASITVQPLGAAAGDTYTAKVKDDGSYHIVMVPGAYKLTFATADGRTVEKDVTVGEDRVDIDVSF